MRRLLLLVSVAAVTLVGALPVAARADEHDDPGFWGGLAECVAAFDFPPVRISSEDDEMEVYQYRLEAESTSDLEERIAELEATTASQAGDGTRKVSIVRWPDGLTWWEDATIVTVARFSSRSVFDLLEYPRFQFTQIGIDPSSPVYENADDPGPNPGNNFSFDIFNAQDGPEIGLTFWDGEQHLFGTYGSAFALADDDQIAFVYPELSFIDIQSPSIWVQTPEGWVSAPLGQAESTLFCGSADFVAQNAGTTAEETPSEEPAQDEQTQQEEQTQAEEPLTEESQEPGASEGEQAPVPAPSSDAEEAQVTARDSTDEDGIPWIWGLVVLAVIALAAGGLATRARSRRSAGAGGSAVAPGTSPKAPPPVAATRVKGPCEDELAAYDMAYAVWAEASQRMNDARDAYALGDARGSEAARTAQEAAEAAEQAAWKAERAAWDVYLNCTAGHREATRTRARQAETPVPPDADPSTTAALTPGATTTDSTNGCQDGDVEWRQEKESASWIEPTGEIDIYMDRTTEAFEDWLDTHGEVHDLTPSYLGWAGIPGAIAGWVHGAVTDDVSATLTLDDVQQLRNQADSMPLFRTDQLKHWVTLWVSMPKQEYLRHCERKWICRGGGWVRTQETRLGEAQFVRDVETERVKYECQTAKDVAQAFERQFDLAAELEHEASNKQNDLRSRCTGS